MSDSIDSTALDTLKTFADFGMKLAASIIVIMGWIISNDETRKYLHAHHCVAWTLGAIVILGTVLHTVGMGFYLHYGIDRKSRLRCFYWWANGFHGGINILLIVGICITLMSAIQND